MGRKWYIPAAGVIILMVIAGCGNRPKEVLSEKEMIGLMADLQLAEAYSQMHYYGTDGDDKRLELARSVLMAHGVSQEQLDTTLAWYGRNMDDYSELYAKVDKELRSRRKKMMKDDPMVGALADADNLWPYASNGIISPLGQTDGWTISLPSPELEKGERLRWAFHLGEYADYTASLGVEYNDGSGESSAFNRSGKQSVEITLQTDTAKTVSRIYGTFRLKNRSAMPLFADSIRLERLPFDSLEYKNFRSQKRYAAPRPVVLKKEEKSDTVSKNDTVVKDPPKELQTTTAPPPGRPGKEKPLRGEPLRELNNGDELKPKTK